ncbi:NAD-dependent epimerase/dehydratase family protein [Flavobacterium rakeshii]|uniref:NAD-dependent epimerase/dehydratase family protein n=1 Tax=Flavobacterium rakeshii TaxID=1038845 RepID=UPI002E7C3E02|nr:NAD-dependent epimerase/dehydratase family protein [Flavobacterium rakeshii]MEE1900063.1 NAD-dependent epimerase/dehydratase family protein [Flavobacterium rakeshii]
MKVILTGTTGMVGEGVLLECLDNIKVSNVLSISRKPCNIQHPKLKELLVPDFTELDKFTDEIQGYDACFYCAGISSVGMNEAKYSFITYDTTISFAKVILTVNPQITFCFISGNHTDSSEKGKLMWARIKGKTENALMRMGFKEQYNFRPGGMLPWSQQKNVKPLYTLVVKIFKFFTPSKVLSLSDVGKAMINVVGNDFQNKIFEIEEMRIVAKNN